VGIGGGGGKAVRTANAECTKCFMANWEEGRIEGEWNGMDLMDNNPIAARERKKNIRFHQNPMTSFFCRPIRLFSFSRP
jgi:hypothetical protein